MKQTFIEVNARFEESGRIMPRSIIWEGREYEVDRVVDIRRRASTKTGGAGLRYTCFILGKERFLFYDDNKWFVESKE